ncbi:guanylate kinase [Clostridium sp. HCP1S3_B4]|uniref:guanylate kinase n=1 Tax=unclassified Clostridium TaxID=2614128 RepID=UPI003F888122
MLIVISGPTGAGKDEIIKELINRNKELYLSVSLTTRPKKSGDIEGVSYNFVTRQEFFKKVEQGLFLEWAEVHENYYGTLKHVVKRKLDEGVNVVLSVDIKGALKVKEEYDDAIFIFVLPSSLERLKERIKADNKIETPEALARKFNSAYKEITAISKYNYGVVANNIDEAVSKIEHIIAAESCRVSRVKSYIKLD